MSKMENGHTSPILTPKSPSAYRHYCCVCSNYRGKVIDGVAVILHRFPADKTLQNIWLKRIKLVSPNFQLNFKNDRLCSAHFQNGVYKKGSKDASIPSIFTMQNGNKKRFAATMDQHNDTNKDIEDLSHGFEEVQPMEVDVQKPLCTNNLSNEQASALLHDYCGFVPSTSVSTHLDKCQQTCSKLFTADQGTQTCGDNLKRAPIMITKSTQTENNVPVEKVSVGIQTIRPDLTFEDIEHSEELCMFYTGIPNAGTFRMLFDELSGDAEEHTQRTGSRENQGRPRMLRLVDELFLVLMRLRLGLLLQDLAQRFHISKSTCSNITNQWITYLSVKLSPLTPWISKQTIIETMPGKFQKKYPACRVIIDCTEIYTETPQSLANKSLMYSHYKSHMTYKALLGISPSGIITFSSDLWAGSVSDKQLTMNSGLLDLCEPGDAIMADKGFLISDLTTPRHIRLIIPPLKYQRFNRRQVEETRRIANLRIDVERAMERVKNFRILQGVIPINLSHQVSNIWKVCVSLSNLLPPLVHDD